MDYAVNKEELKQLLEEVIITTIRETIAELKKSGFLRRDDKAVYKSIDKRLKSFYAAKSEGKTDDPELKWAIKKISHDEYFAVIRLYYEKNFTIETIAEIYQCEVSTVTRNKKRLCLLIDNYLFE